MLLLGYAIPLRDGFTFSILDEELLLPREKSIRFNNVVKIANNGYRRLCITASAEMPLQIAYPKNEIGYDSSARVEFDAEKLVGSTVRPVCSNAC